jgi:hypothetical protein
LTAILITLVTISFQAMKAALANPVPVRVQRNFDSLINL